MCFPPGPARPPGARIRPSQINWGLCLEARPWRRPPLATRPLGPQVNARWPWRAAGGGRASCLAAPPCPPGASRPPPSRSRHSAPDSDVSDWALYSVLVSIRPLDLPSLPTPVFGQTADHHSGVPRFFSAVGGSGCSTPVSSGGRGGLSEFSRFSPNPGAAWPKLASIWSGVPRGVPPGLVPFLSAPPVKGK